MASPAAAPCRSAASFGYADKDFQQALDWLAEGKATIPQTAVRPLKEGPEVFHTLARGVIDDVKIFLG